jgi:hypothetical protein
VWQSGWMFWCRTHPIALNFRPVGVLVPGPVFIKTGLQDFQQFFALFMREVLIVLYISNALKFISFVNSLCLRVLVAIII